MSFIKNDGKVEPGIEETLDNLMVPVEPYLENKIQEFGMNGEEQYVQNASISDKLLQLSGKIDYSFVIAPENKEDKDKKQYPWQDVVQSLSSAYTEVCVLSDLMAMLQQRQYLMLDPVQQTKPPFLPAHVLISKKKGLLDAANILRTGVKSLRGGDNAIDIGKFHRSLCMLNSRFKLRKQGTFILGDASYQTSGSRFQHEALFEVVRDDKCEGGLRIELDPSIKMITFITISYNQVSEAHLKIPRYWKSKPYTHHLLLTTLRTLFCRELFYMLSVECFKFRTIPCRVVDNVLTIPIGERNLYITKHTTQELSNHSGEDSAEESAHNIHEICIQQHLHKIHTSEESATDEQFYSTMFGIVNNKARPRSLFEFTLIHAQHEELASKVLEKLDVFSQSVSDPVITVNVGPVSTPYESSINVTLTPRSRNVITNRCVLRLTLNNPYMCVQLDSSLTGPVCSGKDLNLLMEALQQQARVFVRAMIKTTFLLNNWSILSLDSRAKEEFVHATCPNKTTSLYVTIDQTLTPHLVVSSLVEDEYDLSWDRVPGNDIVHKFFTVLNVIAGPATT